MNDTMQIFLIVCAGVLLAGPLLIVSIMLTLFVGAWVATLVQQVGAVAKRLSGGKRLEDMNDD